jgi:N-acetylneuraminic acid mutarotase
MKNRPVPHTRAARVLRAPVMVVIAAAVLSIAPASAAPGRSLTFEERVAAQKAIEQVYWNHRLWPKDNHAAKPPLATALSDAAIRARVESTLRKSNALEKFWRRPIDPAQLQAELDRMAEHTRDPGLLRELFAALGNDARLIAETLVRQALADRMIRDRFAGDAKLRGAGKRPEVAFEGWWAKEGPAVTPRLDAPSGVFTLPALVTTPCAADSWEATATPSPPMARTVQRAVWTGSEMIVWGGLDSSGAATNAGERYDPALDAWSEISGIDSPEARYHHTAVWTGTEMIVWGGVGVDNQTARADGGRYNPTTDAWRPVSTGANVPEPRFGHTAVWTGTEMIVWGGDQITGSCPDYPLSVQLQTGGRYDPSSDTWMPTSIGPDVPSVRVGATAVWTGTEMIVWGGVRITYDSGDPCNVPYLFEVTQTGGRYDPIRDTWNPTSTAGNVPLWRVGHTAVWTGEQMIVWGGYVGGSQNNGLTDTGGRYQPSTDTWEATSMGANAPVPRRYHSAVWTGARMIIWGGYDEGYVDLDTGGRYDPVTDAWAATSLSDAPAPRVNHSAVWTGALMIVWGGTNDSTFLDSGARYCACPDGTLSYRDTDGDGYGDAAMAGTSCDGLVPPGSVTNDDDCDDTRASVHPGAFEICNGLDDDCDGSVDDTAVPGAVESDTLPDAMTVAWSAVAAARTYDVVYGDLGLLRASGGDFTAATQGCLASHTSATSANVGALPAVGSALWIVVRADNCAGAGTYDSGGPSQVGSRDAEIDASLLTCRPAYCGDDVCNGGSASPCSDP